MLDGDLDQILVVLFGFFAGLFVLLLVMDRLEATIQTQHEPLRRRLTEWWDLIRHLGR